MRFFSTRFISTLSFVFCLSLVILGLFGVVANVSAQQVGGDVFGVAVIDENTQLGGDDIRVTIAKIINGVLMFLGTIAFVLVIYGGFVYMTAGGNEEKISQAKRILINATIGLAIILSAFAITQFIISKLQEATGSGVGADVAAGAGGNCADIGNCPPVGGAPDVQCLRQNNLFVVQSISPNTAPVDGDTGMTNVVVRAVFSQPLHQNVDVNTLLHVRREGENQDIVPAIVRLKENNFVAEAEFAVNTPLCERADGKESSCLSVGNYRIEVDQAVRDAANRLLEIETDCGRFPRETQFTNNQDALDNALPQVAPLSVDGKREDVLGDDALIVRKGRVVAIESQVQDRNANQGGISYLNLKIERQRPNGNEPVDSFSYVDGPRVAAGSHGPYPFVYQLALGDRLDVPAKYGITLRGHDIDGNVSEQNTDVIVVGALCQNGRQDEGENGIDMGGECLGMGQCVQNWQCASNKCGDDGQCVAWPQIQDIIPATWDGAAGNFITIVGKFFGAQAGTVEFGVDKNGSGTIGDEPNEWVEAVAPQRCAAANVPVWTDSWVIVQVPADGNGGNEIPLNSESVIRITKKIDLPPGAAPFQDTSIDEHGPKPGPRRGLFLKNNVTRPGLCSLTDQAGNVIQEGVAGTTVVARGSGFGAAAVGKILFAQFEGEVDLWNNEEVHTTVPALQPTRLFVSVSSANLQSNGVPFSIVRQEDLDTRPVIDAIDPGQTTQGSLVSIFGRNFGARGQVFLAATSEAAAACRPGGGCLEATIDLPGNCGITWDDTHVIVQVPTNAPLGAYFVALRTGDQSSIPFGQLQIVAGAARPGICRIEPKTGPAPRPDGAPLLLTGLNFSAVPTVYFSHKNYDPADITTWLSSERNTIRGNNIIQQRNNEAVRTLIPEDPNGFSMNVGPGKILIESNAGEVSNAVQYVVNDCRTDNAPPGDPNQYRCCAEGDGAGMWVRNGQACPGETRVAGYMWRFTTGKIPNIPRVVEECQEADWDAIDVGDIAVPSPAPWSERAQGVQACLNSSVVVRFSTSMNEQTLTEETVKLFLCEENNNGGANCAGNAREQVAAADLDLSYENGVLWVKQGGLAQNQWYHVELADTIESQEQVRVAGVNRIQTYPLAKTRPCGPGTAYCFEFKTGNGQCELIAASVNPPNKTVSYLGVFQDIRYPFDEQRIENPAHPFYYYVWGRGNQVCQPLAVDGIGWAWGSEDARVTTTVAPNAKYVDSRATAKALANTAPESVTLTAILDEQDDLGPMEATSDVVVDLGDPQVIRYWPQCAESCTNAVIGIEFNRMMMPETYQGGFFVQKCEDEFCRQLVPGNIHLELVEADSPFRYRVRPNPALEEGQWYIAQATNRIISVGSINPNRPGPALVPFSWKFRTKQQDGFCRVETVRLEPHPFTAQAIGEKTKYLSIPYSSPDSCSPLGQELNPWGYEWEWESNDDDVARVSNFTYYGVSKPYCTPSCLYSGSSVGRDTYVNVPPVCGDGLVGPGEDCDIAINGEQPGVSCTLSCLRPGNILAGNDANQAQCGNGIVNTGAGEECDVAHPQHGNLCTNTCTWKGSVQQEPRGEEERAWCGSGSVTDGEDCDLSISLAEAGNTPSQSNIGCSSSCLHLGTPISGQWCAVHINDSAATRAACARAVSICGNAQVEPGEECEIVNNQLRIQLPNGQTQDIVVPGNPATHCSNTCLLQRICGLNIPIVADGGLRCDANQPYCSPDCKILGSSVYYDTPSMCGDSVVAIGEYAACEVAPEEVRNQQQRQNPIQMVTAIGAGNVENGQQSTQIRAHAVAGLVRQPDGTIAQGDINPRVTGVGDYTLQCGFTETDAQENLREQEAGIVRVVDGDMEIPNTDRWAGYLTDVAQKEKKQVIFFDGQSSLVLEQPMGGNPGFVRYDPIPVEPNARIRVSLQYQLREGTLGIALGTSGGVFQTFDGQNHVNGGRTIDVVTGNVWQPYVQDVVIPNGVNRMSLVLRVRGQVYIDAVRVEKIIEGAVISNNCPFNEDGSVGVGTNSCCMPRPGRTGEYPAHGSVDVCRNTVLSFDFAGTSQIDDRSVDGNILLAEGYEEQDAVCPVGQVDVTDRVSRALAYGGIDEGRFGFFGKVWHAIRQFFARLMVPFVDAAVAPIQHRDVELWCAGGVVVTPKLTHTWSDDATSVTSTIHVNIDRPLAQNRVYAVVLLGGPNGIENTEGVSIRSKYPQNPDRAAAFNNQYQHTDYVTFETGDVICKLKGVFVNPPQQLFASPEQSIGFIAETQSAAGQKIQSIPRVYAWDWSWGPVNNPVFTIGVPPAVPNTEATVIASKNVEGQLTAVAQATVTSDIDNEHVGRVFSGVTLLTASFCENPWPQRDVFPYKNNEFHFQMSYCADAGLSGNTNDDLPFLRAAFGDVDPSAAIVGKCLNNFAQNCTQNSDCGQNGQCLGSCALGQALCSNDTACNAVPNDRCVLPRPALPGQAGLVLDGTLERTFFFNEVNDDVIGIQIIQNTEPTRLTAREWFEQKFPFGTVQNVTIAGYDAVTDGNNYYINALNETGNPGERNVYNNIYVLSVNSGAQASTRSVLEQLLQTLTFNTNITDYGYCLHEGVDANVPLAERDLPIDANDLRSFAEEGIVCQSDFDCRVLNGDPREGTNGICSNAKTKFLRDWRRLDDVRLVQSKLENYKENENNSGYPDLLSGTYIPQYTNSQWPSWGRLGSLVGGLPLDPLNRWSQCEVCRDNVVPGENGEQRIERVCEQKDAQTCWDEQASTFYCPLAMSVLEYEAVGNDDYTLHVPLEYFREQEAIVQEIVDGDHVTTERWCQPNAEHNPFGGRCGDGIINVGEECEPPGSQSRSDFGRINPANPFIRHQCPAGQTASRLCNDSCVYEFGICEVGVMCGNGRIEGDELCDDGALNGRYGQCDRAGQRVDNPATARNEGLGCRSQGAGGFCGNGRDDGEQEFCENLQQANGRSLQVVWKGIGQRARVAYGAFTSRDVCAAKGLPIALCSLPSNTDYQAKHCAGDTSLLCTNNDDCVAPPIARGSFDITRDGDVLQNFFTPEAQLQNFGPCQAIAPGRIGMTYNMFQEFSCALDCRSYGSYCGDGVVQAPKEQCDDANDVNTDGCNEYCQNTERDVVEGEVAVGCGNGIIDPIGSAPNGQPLLESCDAGDLNGIRCTPEYGNSCTYCAADCRNVLTVDAEAFCGNGIIDALPLGENGEQVFEACDVAGNTVIEPPKNNNGQTYDNNGRILPDVLARFLQFRNQQDQTGAYFQPIVASCPADRGYVAKGSLTCTPDCKRIDTTACAACGLYENTQGKAVPKFAVLNVLTPTRPNSDWANQQENFRNQNGGNLGPGPANHTRLAMNSAIDNWSQYDPVNNRNLQDPFICLTQGWFSRPQATRYASDAACQGPARFNNLACKQQHVLYRIGFDYSNYLRSQWLCTNGDLVPFAPNYGYERITPETINSNVEANWVWDNYEEKVRQIDASALCTEEYSVYFGSRGVQEKRIEEYWALPNDQKDSFFKTYGDFFPYPVRGERGIVENSFIVSPAIPQGYIRVVVRAKPIDDDGAVSFVGNVFSRRYQHPLPQSKGGRLSYLDVFAREGACFIMEKGNEGIWNNYWKPKTQAHCTSYDNTTMNTIGSVRGITAQATTIDTLYNPNNPAVNNRPFAFYVSAITNDVNIPISDFKNRDVQVEVYIHHENQVPEYSVYKPAYVFDLRNADISNNADFAKYWHVFNIMSNGGQFLITTPDRDDPRQVRPRGTEVQRQSGSVETGFVDILCNVPGEACDREAIE